MLRIGVDLVSVPSVQHAVDLHGQQYLERVYNPAEVEGCRRAGRLDIACLASRWAAKEATIKVLRAGVPWTEVEVVGDRRTQLALSGSARTRAQDCDISALHLSLSERPGWAAALVVAELDLPEAGGPVKAGEVPADG